MLQNILNKFGVIETVIIWEHHPILRYYCHSFTHLFHNVPVSSQYGSKHFTQIIVLHNTSSLTGYCWQIVSWLFDLLKTHSLKFNLSTLFRCTKCCLFSSCYFENELFLSTFYFCFVNLYLFDCWAVIQNAAGTFCKIYFSICPYVLYWDEFSGRSRPVIYKVICENGK